MGRSLTLKTNRTSQFNWVIAFAALNGMLSEFLLAHLMALTWGSIYKQYALTMGLFVLSMGFGAWKFRSSQAALRSLIKILMASIFFIVLAFAFTWAHSQHLFSENILLAQLILILVLGFLSGAELPLLEQIQKQLQPISSVSQVLIWDYLGMAMGSLLFGFYMLQAWGVLGTLIFICCLHIVMIGWLLLGQLPKGESL